MGECSCFENEHIRCDFAQSQFRTQAQRLARSPVTLFLPYADAAAVKTELARRGETDMQEVFVDDRLDWFCGIIHQMPFGAKLQDWASLVLTLKDEETSTTNVAAWICYAFKYVLMHMMDQINTLEDSIVTYSLFSSLDSYFQPCDVVLYSSAEPVTEFALRSMLCGV